VELPVADVTSKTILAIHFPTVAKLGCLNPAEHGATRVKHLLGDGGTYVKIRVLPLSANGSSIAKEDRCSD